MNRRVERAIGSAWNIQAGKKVYPLRFGTSDVEGIKMSLDEAGYIILPRWLVGIVIVAAWGLVLSTIAAVRYCA